MSLENYATYREIKSQTSAWQNALEVAGAVSLPQPKAYQQVIFTGCGSTYYLSLAAAALYQEFTGQLARAVPASELLLNPQMVLAEKTPQLLVAISRSGTTTETIRAVEAFRDGQHGPVVGISNYTSTLAASCDIPIVIPAGQEESIAQTRSFASMYVAVTAFCARLGRRPDLADSLGNVPEAGASLMDKYESLAKEIGENLDFDRFYFLGSGLRYGLACEVNLKMKEMTLTHSEPFHFLEFRHGPMSMVNEKAVVVGLLSGSNFSYEKAVLSEMQILGGRTVGLAESEADISFQSGIHERVRNVLYLPVLQLMAFYRSLAKGLNPDRPKNLTAVVQLKM
jgi:glucosamine--fructose-6-phosphate aminotransferase (isomerizing)